MYETIVPLDYVTKDYEGFLQTMKDLIPVLLPEWTDYNESDFGMVLLQLAAYGLHILSYYQDKGFNESILEYATQRESIVLLCRMLGYELAIQEPATTQITFTKFSEELGNTVVIPAKTKVSTDPQLGDVVVFETDEQLIINAGDISGNVNATQGETTFNEIIGIGENKVNQEVVIDKESILINDMNLYTVEMNVARTWTKVDDFLDSLPTDRHYKAVIEGNFYTKIIFGNGTNGMRVPNMTPIYCTYTVGGGTKGRLAEGKINYLQDDIPAIESITSSATSGGVDFESPDVAKILAPKVYKTMNRAVTAEDFESLAKKVPGVVKAKLIETFNDAGDVNLYIVPSTYGEVTETLRKKVYDKISKLMVLNNTLNVYGTEYVYYHVDILVEVFENYSNAEKKAEIEAYITNILHPQYYEHGETISTSYIAGYVHRVSGVKKVIVNAFTLGATPSDDLYCNSVQFLKLDALTVMVEGGI